jgi:5-methylcytosine-specific restriction enzyme subunit McrC
VPIIREFGRLTTEPVSPSLDQASISASAFHWLAEHATRREAGAAIISLETSRVLRVLNYVGVIDTPCGTRIEILPKHTEEAGSIGDARGLLVSMVIEALRLKPRTGTISQIARFKLPLPEWLAARFLEEASELIRRGLRQAYRQIDAREPFLRGSLDVARQVRSGPGTAHLFNFRQDVFTFNRPENRLIRSSVELVLRSTRSSDTWRAARELSAILDDVPESREIAADFVRWGEDRLMADYAPIRPLCELLLLRQAPFAIAGRDSGLSMLFPMERLFETYVVASLRRVAPPGFEIRAQAGDLHLCRHQGSNWFRMRPDILVQHGVCRWIIDAKWKLLNGDRSAGYGLNQADFYQLHAYGQSYLEGAGDMFLVYPQTTAFGGPLPPFSLSEGLKLHVLPFDLTTRSADYSFLSNGTFPQAG